MRFTSKFIILPCLAVSAILAGLSIPRTMAYFTDRREYSVLLLPYDGRGAVSLTFEDGSTIRSCQEGEQPVLKVVYTNHSAAAVKELSVSITDEWDHTESLVLSDVASGESREASVVFPALTGEQLSGALSPENGTGLSCAYFRYTLVTDSGVSYVDPFDGMVCQAVVPSMTTDVYICKGEPAP